MRVYRLDVDIDGFGGKDDPKFFYSFNDACKSLQSHAGFYYNAEDDEWDIEMVKEVRTTVEEDSLSILGIPYPDSWRYEDPYYINYARASITPLDIDGECNGKIYLLGIINGYNTYLARAIDNIQPLCTGETVFNQFREQLFTFSKNYARKIARIKYKKIARGWNNKEFEARCSIITGGGEDYLSIREYVIKGGIET